MKYIGLLLLGVSLSILLIALAWDSDTVIAKNPKLEKAKHSANMIRTAGDSCCMADGAAQRVGSGSVYHLRSEWTDENGNRIRLGSLGGKVRVVAMFYSRCTSACPVIIGEMKRIESSLPADLKPKVGFVLISFDPAHDTPLVLHDVSAERGLDSRNWTLLTGSSYDDRTLAAMLGVEYRRESDGVYVHSSRITVLDRGGNIVRSYGDIDHQADDVALTIERAAARQ